MLCSLRVVAVLIFAVLNAGCSGDDGPDPIAAGSRQAPEKDDCAGMLQFCDILQLECQRDIFNVTACVRGDTAASLPKVRTIDMETLRQELMQEFEDQPELPPNPWDAATVLLELIAAEDTTTEAAVDDFVTGVAAYYVSGTDSVTIVEGSAMGDDELAVTILSHEFVHALQDRHENLRWLSYTWGEYTDTATALSHLVEGEAQALSTLVQAIGRGLTEDEAALLEYFDALLVAFIEAIEEAPSPFYAAIGSLHYAQGGRVVTAVRQQGGQARVDQMYVDGPGVSADWIGDDPPVATDADTRGKAPSCAAQGPGEGRVIVGIDRFGALGLMGFLVGQGMVGEDALALSRWLVADEVVVFDDDGDAADPDAIAVEWRLEFDAPARAQEVAAAITSTAIGVATDGERLRLWAAGVAAPLSDLAARDECVELDAVPAIRAPSAVPLRILPAVPHTHRAAFARLR